MSIKFVLKRNSQTSQTTNNEIIAEYAFESNLFTIGSDSGNNLVLEEAAFEQAVVVREGEQVTLINSADGTILNNVSLAREAIEPLNIGDRIGIGNYLILVADSTGKIETNAAAVFTTNEDNVTDIFATTQNEPLDIYATTKFNVSDISETEFEKPLPVALPESPEIPLLTAAHTQENAAPQKNFAEILDTLRTEDDSFYFTVKNNDQELKRIALDQPETPLGTASGGEIVALSDNLAPFWAVARKDWSGILLESQKANAVSVNGEKIDAPRRLRHEDEIVFAASPKYSLVLHEPSSLVALESLLSTRNNFETQSDNFGLHHRSSSDSEINSEKETKESFLERKYFKHFSFFEFISMIIGTLIGAVLIFLLLEFIFSPA